MVTVGYGALRVLSYERRDTYQSGMWSLSMYRVMFGEGLPDNDLLEAAVQWDGRPPAPPLPLIDPTLLRPNRPVYYRRLRTASECARHSPKRMTGIVQASCWLTPDWVAPPAGVLSAPTPGGGLLNVTHAVKLGPPVPDRGSTFWHDWGADWGDRGYGYMPDEYFDRLVFECWASYTRREDLRRFEFKALDNHGHVKWSARTEGGHRAHAFEVRDALLDERYAWAFVVERDGAMELEELFVRPEFRRLGHGAWLAERVGRLAREKRLPLRVWVPFVDCQRESPHNYPALVATARRLGVQFQPCPVPWAAYFATTENPGSDTPVEPATIPPRPMASRAAVLAAALALVGGAPIMNGAHPAPVMTTPATVAVGTPEWDALTERRAALIHKKNRAGLTADERAEFERLQAQSSTAIERTFPRPRLSPAELAVLERTAGDAPAR